MTAWKAGKHDFTNRDKLANDGDQVFRHLAKLYRITDVLLGSDRHNGLVRAVGRSGTGLDAVAAGAAELVSAGGYALRCGCCGQRTRYRDP